MEEIITLGLASSGHDELFAELAMPSAMTTGHHHHSGVAVGARSCYPANIAAACYQVNVALHHEKPQPVKVEDELQREKRRKSNRLSAQRWRMRKRSKFSELQEQIHLLQKDQEVLERENAKLKTEFNRELALAKEEEAAHKASQLAAACPPENTRPAYYQNVSMGHRHRLEWPEKTPQGMPHGYALAPSSQPLFPEGTNNAFYYNKPRSNMLGHVGRFMPISDATTHPMLAQHQLPMARSGTFGFPQQGSGVSRAQLQNMIRTATAPCIS